MVEQFDACYRTRYRHGGAVDGGASMKNPLFVIGLALMVTACQTAMPAVDPGFVPLNASVSPGDPDKAILVAGVILDPLVALESALVDFGLEFKMTPASAAKNEDTVVTRRYWVPRIAKNTMKFKQHMLIYVKPGEYYISSYIFSNKSSRVEYNICMNNTIRFHIEPGEIAYIGDLNFTGTPGKRNPDAEKSDAKAGWKPAGPDFYTSMNLKLTFDPVAAQRAVRQYPLLLSDIRLVQPALAKSPLVTVKAGWLGVDQQQCQYEDVP